MTLCIAASVSRTWRSSVKARHCRAELWLSKVSYCRTVKNRAKKTRLSLIFLANWIHRCWTTRYHASLTRRFKTSTSLCRKTCRTIRLWWWCGSNSCCQDRQWRPREWGPVWIISFDPRKTTGITTIADRVCASGKPRVTWVDQASRTLITTRAKCKLCTIAIKTKWVH